MTTARRSNAVRRASTRAAVLEATVEAIVRYGYAGATSTRIAELSGFTRGAQIHHFGSKAAMVTEALLHLQDKLSRELMDKLAESRSRELMPLLEGMWRTFGSDVYLAATELHTAARSDPELRAALLPVEREIGHRMRESLSELLDDGRHSRLRLGEVADLVMNTLRGMAAQLDLQPSSERETRQLATLAAAVEALLR